MYKHGSISVERQKKKEGGEERKGQAKVRSGGRSRSRLQRVCALCVRATDHDSHCMDRGPQPGSTHERSSDQ